MTLTWIDTASIPIVTDPPTGPAPFQALDEAADIAARHQPAPLFPWAQFLAVAGLFLGLLIPAGLWWTAATTPAMAVGSVVDRYTVADVQVLLVDLGSPYGPDRITVLDGTWRGCDTGDRYNVITTRCT